MADSGHVASRLQLGRARARLNRAIGPRLGRLVQHSPRALEVPASYSHIAPDGRRLTVGLTTPSFRQGEYIGRTVRSVLAQGHPGLRYVVQDAGSDDATIPTLQGLESPAWSWRSEPDDGQADAINRGLAGLQTDIVGWLNADDLLLPGALHHVSAHFAAHPKVDVVYGHRMLIDRDDRSIGLWVTPIHDDAVLRLADYVPQETMFMRRATWERVGGVDESLRYALDWDLLLRFADAGARIERLPRFLGAFRVHADQKTTAIEDVGAAEVRALRARVHGRDLTAAEVHRALRPYLRRSVPLHIRHRAAHLLPRRRMSVTDWLDAPTGERRHSETVASDARST